ncbi:MAG: hypothetical protein QGG88_04960 [Gammaproteobacteria bacterium]|jgi:hypothetical protein|nr:hypothetical protein [Gammaproteobacteria bacterium]
MRILVVALLLAGLCMATHKAYAVNPEIIFKGERVAVEAYFNDGQNTTLELYADSETRESHFFVFCNSSRELRAGIGFDQTVSFFEGRQQMINFFSKGEDYLFSDLASIQNADSGYQFLLLYPDDTKVTPKKSLRLVEALQNNVELIVRMPFVGNGLVERYSLKEIPLAIRFLAASCQGPVAENTDV